MKDYITQYSEEFSTLAHKITGQYLIDGKIATFKTTKIPHGVSFKVYFTDDGRYLEVEVKTLTVIPEP